MKKKNMHLTTKKTPQTVSVQGHKVYLVEVENKCHVAVDPILGLQLPE